MMKKKGANHFAADMLIPNKMYNSFLAEKGYSGPGGVRAFAQQLGIAPGIIVGRLQHDDVVPFRSLNYLKRRFRLVEKSN